MSLRRATRLVTLSLAALAAHLVGCADPEPSGPDEEWGMEGPVSPVPEQGKEDSEHRRGLWVNTNTTRTQVWSARNAWEDRDTPAARRAGLAWGESSGLSWDEKYARWIDSLAWTQGVDGYSQTVILTTPWGKTLPSPSLECAEMSIFLRITFSAWYELPFFMETVDAKGVRIYIGHNGVRTQQGRYASTPEFGVAYRDHSSLTPAQWMASWPQDATLRGRKLYGGEDNQRALWDGAPFGAYLDEIHLNKRVGYFTALAINYLGSANLADSANTYNIVPEAVRAGDTLVQRWQRNGIGHTLVVKEVIELAEGNKDVVTISGSMPRRQAKRESGVASKSYFTSAYAGGPGTNSDGHEYARLGGGLKRWRVTKNVDGYWTNTWMRGDEAHWINSTDYPRIAARPARFGQLLGQVTPQQQRAELLAQIEDARRHLGNYPASCAARARRERAFEELYDLSERSFGQTRAQVDAQHRRLEDYVLGELVYGSSKTCCWNSTTAAMYGVIMDHARDEQAQAEAAGTCVAPTVFKAEVDGYQRWAAFAAATGRAAAWRAWSEDEACPQRAVASDTAADGAARPYCELGGGGGGACTDAHEPNDSRGQARPVTGTVTNLRICAGDEDWFAIAAGGVVRIEFSHAAGDLDLAAHDAAGNRVAISQGTGDTEQVTVPAGGTVRVYGYAGAQGAYTLRAP